EISKIPGLPPLYTHEWSPQIVRPLLPEGRFEFFGSVYTRLSDGVMIVSNSIYEKETMNATKSWLAQIGKPSYAMAPLSLPKPRTQVDSDNETLRFLDSIQEQFGPNSLIYISFGTFFWPPQQEKLDALIGTLIANKKPFILSHASPLAAQIPSELLTSIRSSGIGLALSWSPQETILHHEATGWFITHGGWNSIQESFEAKVPLIFWPMGADQPVNAAVLGLTHKAAFELVEVRSGENGTKPLLRFENTGYKPLFTVDAVKAEIERLLVQIDGEEGRMVRSNFRKLGNAMQESWNDGEESRMELNEFLKKFVDCI
ncbi:glycosyltransferase family 1 protein, partial [Collybiopsis luxurians FD-317 M1]